MGLIVKFYLILILSIFLTINCSGQQNYIGWTTTEIETQLVNDSNLQIIGHTKHSISVVNKQFEFGATYLFNKGICYSYILTYTYDDLELALKLLNKLFIRYDVNTWFNFNDNKTYQLKLEKDEDFFNIVWILQTK